MHKIYQSSHGDTKAILKLLQERNLNFNLSEEGEYGMLAIAVDNEDADALNAILEQVKRERGRQGLNVQFLMLVLLCILNLLMLSIWYLIANPFGSREVFPFLSVAINSAVILLLTIHIKSTLK